jgi:uncharacterized protein (TIGR01777 family)
MYSLKCSNYKKFIINGMGKIVLIGGSGFIGRSLLPLLNDFEVVNIKGRDVNSLNLEELAFVFNEAEVIINLSGQSIVGYWTKTYKKKLYDSRVVLTKKIGDAIAMMKKKPGTFINASAVGIYADGKEVDEDSVFFAENYLANLVQEWEKAAINIKHDGLKVVLLRFGIVLGKTGGAYPVLRRLVKFNLGTVMGRGNQSYSFIYIYDAVRAIRFVIDNKIEGIVNMVSPNYSTNKELMLSLKRHFKRWFLWFIPAWFLKLILAESSIVYLEGQRVIPGVLLRNGFKFEVESIEHCIEKIEQS